MASMVTKGQVSRHCLRRTCNEWRTAADLAAANQEIADLRKLLAESEAERDGMAIELDEANTMIRGLAQEIHVHAPHVNVAGFEGLMSYVARHFEQHEKIG